MHDLVAPTEDIPARHFITGALLTLLTLLRGQIGTVVMTYDGRAFEVEFADAWGCAFAILPIETAKLLLLHDAPSEVVAA